jgi:hypothetical protein
MTHDLPTYLKMRLANGDVALMLRVKPDEK